MRYLLDTHTFIWWDQKSANLSPRARALFHDTAARLLLSIASVWEIQIKLAIGKLALPAPLMDIVNNQIKTNQIELLPITLSHIASLDGLPMYHRDPFDRMLVAQAISEQIPIISADPVMGQYPVTAIWK